MYRTMLTSPVFGLRREIDRLFEDTFANTGERSAWVPAVNIRETDNSYDFEIELAGFKPEDVELTCDNGVLTVRGEHREERKEGEDGRYHLVERRHGEFTRSFQLPQGVNDDSIDARFDNGLLRVRVPKAEIPKPRRIDIGSGKEQGRQEGQAAIRGPGSSGEGSSSKENGGSKTRQREMAGASSR